MRVGFVTQLLWSRYGEFWVKLVTSAGLEPTYAPTEGVWRVLGDARLQGVPGLVFRLAAAQALALEADVILAPALNPEASSARGSGQDPFIADFPEALAASVSGLPPVVGVPASLVGELEGLVVSTLHTLTHDAALVRRVWARHRVEARAPRVPEPKWRVRSSDGGTTGVIGQPWLLRDAFVEGLKIAGHRVSQGQLDPVMLRNEGRRIDERLIPTDLEVLGAARFLGRKGSVTNLVMLADGTSGADAWLLGRVARIVHKPFRVVYVQELGEVADKLLPS